MTAQIPERLILDGEETAMTFVPPLPDGHPRIVETPLDARTGGDTMSGILYSTACWRRYQGTWEIKDGRFYLTGLRGQFQLKGDEPLLADWFSGVIRIPRGKMLQYVHMGFGSVYEQELHIKIEHGEVIKSRLVDNRGKKFDVRQLGYQNLPGGENRFPGDDELNESCRCYRSPNSQLLTHRELGMDARYGEISILTCPVCGQLWLRYHYELEAFSYSGRWYLGAITPQQAEQTTAQNAQAILEGLNWYFFGGSYFFGRISRKSGPLSL